MSEEDEQIQRLADCIVDEVPGEPSRSEGAVDTAIRLLRGMIERDRLDGVSARLICAESACEAAEEYARADADTSSQGVVRRAMAADHLRHALHTWREVRG